MGTPAVVAVGTAGQLVPLPTVRAVQVINSSEGPGDGSGAPDIVVSAGLPAAITPQQVGVRLAPGEVFEFPLYTPNGSAQLGLYAIADGAGARLTVRLDNDAY